MKILFVGSSTDWHIDLWVQYFTEENAVFLFSDKENYLKNQLFKNVKIIESEGYLGGALNFFKVKSHRLFQLNKLISTKYFGRYLDAVIRDHNIDIIHAHSLYYGFLASFIKSDVPVVFTPMGSDVILHAQTNQIYRYMAKNAFRRANVVTGVSVLLQKRGCKVGAGVENNYIIQNGVDRTVFFPKPNGLKKHYQVDNDEILLFSPRAITPLYNIDIIVSAIAHLKSAGYRVKCMFSYAFGGEYLEQLRKQIKVLDIEPEIIWLGHLSYEEMAKHYNVADIVVSVPSSDSSPKSVYEAMFCKKPIVVSDLEWSHETLGGCNCLERVPVRDALKLSEVLARLIDSSDQRDELSVNAQFFAHKYFDYKNSMSQMEKIMLELLKE